MYGNECYLLQGVMNNGSIYLHFYVVKSGYSPDPESERHSKKFTMHSKKSEYVFRLPTSSVYGTTGRREEKGKGGANAMKCVAAGAHLPTPWLFEPAKRPDDRADYRRDCSILPKFPGFFLQNRQSNTNN